MYWLRPQNYRFLKNVLFVPPVSPRGQTHSLVNSLSAAVRMLALTSNCFRKGLIIVIVIHYQLPNPLKGRVTLCQLVTLCHPGLTYIFDF